MEDSNEEPSSHNISQCLYTSGDESTRPLFRSDAHDKGKLSRQHLPGQAVKLRVVLCILLTELCERLTFYGITANLVIFCKDVLNFPSPFPTTVSLLFQGTCYFIPIFGGWLADSYTGRFNTIFGSSLIYLVGTILLATVSSTLFPAKSPPHDTSQTVYFIIALCFIAVGTGGIKANVSPFGADQVHRAGPQEVAKFFNWFYWFINIGSFIAFTVIVYLQQKFNFFYGYAITAGTMLLAVVIFTLGRNSYITKPASGSHLTDTVKIVWQGLRGVWKRRTSSEQTQGQGWLDHTKTEFGGNFSTLQVEDVKILLRILPIFLMVVMYWTVYAQMQTSYLIQSTYMTINVGHFEFPVASLSIFDILSVLTLIPLMDRVIYPAIRYCGVNFTPLRRIGVGMLFAVASVCVAGLIEIERKSDRFRPYFNQTAFKTSTPASKMSIFYQVPQFILIGASEVLTSITGLEFAYSQAPKCLQGLVMGIFLVTSGLGNYLASVLVNIVNYASHNVWYDTAQLNKGKLEYFFFLLGGLMFLNFLIFIAVAWQYEYVIHPEEQAIIISNSDTDTSTNDPNAGSQRNPSV